MKTPECTLRPLIRPRWAITLILLLLTSLASAADDQQQEAWRQRLINQAIPGWERLKASMTSISGSVTSTYWYRTDDPKDAEFGHDFYVKRTGTFWLTPGAERYVFDSYDRTEKWLSGWVYCSNPDYSFVQNKSVQAATFLTTDYGRSASVSNSVKVHLDRVKWAMVPYNGYVDSPLADLVRSDRCHVIAWDDISRDGRKLVQVELDYPPPQTGPVWDPSNRRTKLILDPQAEWRILSTQTSSAKVASDLDVTYDPNGPELGRISKVEFVVHEPNRNLENLETIEFSSLSYAPIPVDDLFYLPEHPRRNPATAVGSKSDRPSDAANSDASWLSMENAVYLGIAVLVAVLLWWAIRRGSARA